jgi:hypothetical protein
MRHLARRRAPALLVAMCATLAMASTALGDEKASRACRGALGKNLAKLAKTGFKTADSCHRTANKEDAPSGPCNNIATFDAKGKYANGKTKASSGIDGKCLAGDPVLDNYDGMSAEGAVYPRLDDEIAGNSGILLGAKDLMGDGDKAKCLAAIGKARTSIISEILKGATKCQANVDKTATTFGTLDPSCEADPTFQAPKGSEKAMAKIPAGCGSLTGNDVGSCDPLPTCVIDTAKATGQVLAREFYQSISGVGSCGNSIVDPGEQCDGGTACNASCEFTYGTCSPPLSGNRVVHVRLTSPSPLAAARIDLNYPLFDMSIPGIGNSSLVRGRVSQVVTGGNLTLNDTDNVLIALLDNTTNFIPAGTDVGVLDVTFDRCVELGQNICSRNPNVFGCTTAFNRCTCTAAADCGPGGNPACALINGSTVGKQCTGGAATKVNCTSNTQCATGQTCEPDPQGEFNPPICSIGHFPQAGDHQPPFIIPTEVGPCDGTDLGPPGGCPSGNDCRVQDGLIGCTVSNPSDQDGNPVFGVGCSITIDEPPPASTTTTTAVTTTSTTATTSTATTTTDTSTTDTSTTSTTDTTTTLP